MRRFNNRIATIGALLAASGAAASASAQTVINVSGATLLEAFFRAPASTNDYIDADGDGFGRIHGNNDQLAPAILPPAPGFGQNLQHWIVQYSAVGSVNGFQELVDHGQVFVTTDATDANGIPAIVRERAFCNRTQFINTGVGSSGIFNAGNPGGCPVRANMVTLQATYAAPPAGSSGGYRNDIAPLDVPSRWAVRIAGAANFEADPGTPGYGMNPRRSVNAHGTATGANLDNLLANLGGLNLYDPADEGAANSSTIFNTPMAFAPIAVMTNFGTGLTQIDVSDIRYLTTTGRLKTGENLVCVTRDSGSGTRNGFMNSICVDPSWGVGENVGPLSSLASFNLLGPDFTPSNKAGSGGVEATVINHRLAIGYIGAERGVSAAWLTGGKAEVLAVRNDTHGGTQFVRPTLDAVLDNDENGYIIGGPAGFATIGDSRGAPVSKGGDAGNTHPDMLNIEAATYLNNITRSVAAFIALPGGDSTLFTPGEYLASQFVLTDATDFIQDPADPCTLIPNPNFNLSLQDFIRNNPGNVLRNAGYASFGLFSQTGKTPTRLTGITYSDGVSGGATNYVTQGGVMVSYGTTLSLRNRVCGDFNGDGVRNILDAADMVAAWRQRNGGPAWIAPAGTGSIAGAPGADAIIEVLGDFDGDGSFTGADVRYFADGLAMKASTDLLDRREGFAAIDGALGGNFFGTVLATGAVYEPGDSRGDVAGPTGASARGFAPVGADGVVNGRDIDFVFAQFIGGPGRPTTVTDGEANWDDIIEAVSVDLSADMTGDLKINRDDVAALVEGVLETTIGDVNLDGTLDEADRGVLVNNPSFPGFAGGWSQGDVTGDGVVDGDDLAVIDEALNPCLADWNGVDGLDSQDFFDFLDAFFNGDADFNHFDGTDSQDYFDFLEAFFTGC